MNRKTQAAQDFEAAKKVIQLLKEAQQVEMTLGGGSGRTSSAVIARWLLTSAVERFTEIADVLSVAVRGKLLDEE